MTTNNHIYFALCYFVNGNQIDLETYKKKADWSSRVAPSIHLLVEKGLADMTLAEGKFLPISAILTKAGRERRNKELRVDL
jgi:hypothetical protein